MIYLAVEMAVYLILAALAGLAVGWWSNQLLNNTRDSNSEDEETEYFAEDDIFAIKARLDNCFDDNAQLRRDLKASHEKLERLNNNSSIEDTSIISLKEKVEVLLDDLQIRDDTIVALEKELKALRSV